jgi:Zn-dependent protease
VIAQLKPEEKEGALAVGAAAAVVWGIAVSLYAFSFGAQDIGWVHYLAALVGGVAACLVLPPLALAARALLRFRHSGRH